MQADASVDAGSRDAGNDAASAWVSLDDIAARAPTVAAGMREEKRQEIDARGSLTTELVRAPLADLCVRVSLVTTKPVHAWLEDIRGSQLADGGTGARLLLAARGPVCVRKGDAIVLRAEGREPFTLRAIVWASP